MERYVEYRKLSKKQKRLVDDRRRGSWGEINPVTRKTENKKLYNRKRAGRRFDIDTAGFVLCLNQRSPDKRYEAKARLLSVFGVAGQPLAQHFVLKRCADYDNNGAHERAYRNSEARKYHIERRAA